MVEIQRKATRQSQRSAISRLFHVKNNKDKIAAWKVDLNRILQIFNVRCVASPPGPLIILFQTELAIDTNVAVAGARREVSNTYNIVSNTQIVLSDTQNVVSDTHIIVSDIHRAVVKHQEASGGGDLPVSNRYPGFVN